MHAAKAQEFAFGWKQPSATFSRKDVMAMQSKHMPAIAGHQDLGVAVVAMGRTRREP